MFCCLSLSLFVSKMKDSSLRCIASYDALRSILFYTSHQYRIYLHICHFELVYTRTNVWNQFPLFRGCGVRPQFTFCVYSNLSISSWPESQTETSQQHSLLVLTPRPSIALVSPQCALYVRSARVSSECARFYRAQIIILRHFTAHESFSFVLCANN